VVALTGDFVHHGFRYVELIAHLVGELRASRGVFAVLGNHDHAQRNAWLGRRTRLATELTRALESHGVRVLRNQAVTVGTGHSRLAIAGVDDLWSRQADVDQALADVPAGIPRIVLAHNPRTIECLGTHRCDVMLSGHTHGGQVTLPRAGSPMLPPGMRRYRAGLYECQGRYLYVSKGVGCGLRVRYRTRPEVAVLRLVSRQAGD
jgi:predicted MPP superfamily phosphohydrolase